MKYEQPNVIALVRATDLIQSCVDKPSCNFLDNAIEGFILWSTGTAYQADE